MTVGGMLAVVLRPSKLRYNATRSLTKTKRIRASLTAFFSMSIAVVLFVAIQLGAVFWTSSHSVYAYEKSYVITSQPATLEANNKKVDPSEIKAVLDAWAKKYSGKASVVITDTQSGDLLANSNADKQYFTASMYKLYVAYLSSQDIDSGVHVASEPFLGTYSRQDCIVRMIQFSDSPCGEKMLNEMGKKQADARLITLGLTSTSMAGFKTTATDAAFVTRKVALGEGLSKDSARNLQEAMSEQMYRDALPTGFKNSKVADKVGFYETGYHDSANVTLKEGRTFTVSILSENMGSRQIAELARTLEPIFIKLK
jgi:beta-lactamase class A